VGVRRTSQSLSRVALAIVVTFAGSFALAFWFTDKHATLGFFLLPSRAWELAAGGLAAMYVMHVMVPAPRVGFSLATFGLAMIAAAVSGTIIVAPIGLTAIAVAGSGLIIIGNAMDPRGALSALLSTTVLVSIGLASYGWYLWHWPALSLVRAVMAGEMNVWRDVSVSGLTLALSFGTLRWIENPLRYARRSAGRVLQIGSLTGALFCLVAAATGIGIKFLPLSPRDLALKSAMMDRADAHKRCILEIESTKPVALGPCLASESERGPRFLLWGDSFADHWAPALELWSAKYSRAQLVVEHLTKGACPPLLGATPTQPGFGYLRAYEDCRRFNDLAAKRVAIAGNIPGSSIILSANWWFRATDADLDNDGWSSEPHHSFDASAPGVTRSLTALETHLRLTLATIQKAGIRHTLVILQSPILVKDHRLLRGVACLYRRSETYCATSLRDHEERSREVNLTIRRVAAEFDNVRVFDPTDGLCVNKSCPARVDGVVAYLDEGHLTASMARRMAETTMLPYLHWLGETAPPWAVGATR
jgi:hypothetical protein